MYTRWHRVVLLFLSLSLAACGATPTDQEDDAASDAAAMDASTGGSGGVPAGGTATGGGTTGGTTGGANTGGMAGGMATGGGMDCASDTVAPTLDQVNPASPIVLPDGVGSASVGLVFSEPMQNVDAMTLMVDNGATIDSVEDMTGMSTSFRITLGTINEGTTTLTIPAETSDACGNTLAMAETVEFNQSMGADRTPPMVMSTVPEDMAVGIGVGDVVVVTFSERMDEGAGMITINDGTMDIPVRTRWGSQGTKYTVTPQQELAVNATVTVTMSGFQDDAGNALTPQPADGMDYVFSYDTSNDPCVSVMPASVTSTSQSTPETGGVISVSLALSADTMLSAGDIAVTRMGMPVTISNFSGMGSNYSFDVMGTSAGDVYDVAVNSVMNMDGCTILSPGIFRVTVVMPQPIESLVGCSSGVCTRTVGGGPNGGDLLAYELSGGVHPVVDDFEDGSTCFTGTAGADLIIEVDVTGFTTLSVDTCDTNLSADSSVALFSGPPSAATLIPGACTEDQGGGVFCAQVGAAGGMAPASPFLLPQGTTTVFVVIDEYNDGNYWDEATTRRFNIELTNANVVQGGGEACADAAQLNMTGPTIINNVAGSTRDVLDSSLIPSSCLDGFSYLGDADSVFQFTLQAPHDGVVVSTNAGNQGDDVVAVLLDSGCASATSSLACNSTRISPGIALNASGLSPGTYHVVMGNRTSSDAWPDTGLSQITVLPYTVLTPPLAQNGAGQVQVSDGSTMSSLSLPLGPIGYVDDETLRSSDSSYRLLTVPGATGFALSGTYDVEDDYDYFQIRHPSGAILLNVTGVGSFSNVFIPGDTVIVGVNSDISLNNFPGYTLTDVTFAP